MKKMSVFAILALLVLSIAGVAQAADIKASGVYQIDSSWNNDLDFATQTANSATKNFHIEQRMRTAFQFIANENLKGVLETQIGTNNWGQGQYSIGAGRTPNTTAMGGNSAGNGNIMLRKGYIDFKWPGTKVNFITGFQTVKLPSAFGGGSAILDDQVAAAVVSSPITDNVKVLGGYVRAADSNGFGSTSAANPSFADVVFAALPIDFTGYNITPFGAFMYANSNYANQNDAGLSSRTALTSAGTRAYFGGVAFTMTAFDPIKVMADFNYGTANYKNYSLGTDADKGGRQGWLFDLAVDYTGLSMMTPEAFFVYSSGEGGASSNKSGRMPTIGNPQGWTVNNSLFFGDRNFISGFSTTTTGSYGGYARSYMGFWTAGISLKDIKVIDKLSSQFNILFAKGTNDPEYVRTAALMANSTSYGRFLTQKDHIWEIDLNNKYKIYDELSLLLDLNYVNASFDKDTWRRYNRLLGDNNNLESNVYRIALGLNYSF